MPFLRKTPVYKLEKGMVQKSDLKIIKEEIERLNRDFTDPGDEETYRTSVVLFSAALGVGPYIDDLAEFTGYPRDFIANISHRMHAAGLWEDWCVHDQHWWVDDSYEKIERMGLWLDVLVGTGYLVAKRMEDGEFGYCPAQYAPVSKEEVM